jgi:hypothetical protein
MPTTMFSSAEYRVSAYGMHDMTFIVEEGPFPVGTGRPEDIYHSSESVKDDGVRQWPGQK